MDKLLEACRKAITVLTIMNAATPDPRAEEAIQELQQAMDDVEHNAKQERSTGEDRA